MLWWVRDRFQSSLLDNTTLNVHGHCSSVIAFAFWQRCTHQAWSWAGELAQILQKILKLAVDRKKDEIEVEVYYTCKKGCWLCLFIRSITGTLWNMYDGAFSGKKNKTFLEVNYFCKKSPSNRLNWVLIMLLLIVDF